LQIFLKKGLMYLKIGLGSQFLLLAPVSTSLCIRCFEAILQLQ
jgi:hypothetical protein